MEDRLNSAHFLISYDPPRDGNNQFSVICETLRNIGLYRSVKTLREQIVEYLFITDAWPTYLQNMAKNGTFGDHLTLQAAADLFNVEFNVISSLGPAATTVISPQNSVPISSFYIGHFAEGDGEHYVALQNDAMWQERMEERAAESDEVPESDNATQEKNSVTSEVAAEESHMQENTYENTSEVTSDGDNQAPILPPNQCSSSSKVQWVERKEVTMEIYYPLNWFTLQL